MTARVVPLPRYTVAELEQMIREERNPALREEWRRMLESQRREAHAQLIDASEHEGDATAGHH